MNVIGAITAGLGGTVVISMVMAMAPKMGMPKMDIVGMLGTMFNKDGNVILGWVVHLMMGTIFALIYAALWSFGIGSATLIWGLVFGAGHWLVAGMMMGVMPMMHAGIKSGTVDAPGVFTMNNGGIMAFMGGMVGHMIFGMVVALTYSAFLT